MFKFYTLINFISWFSIYSNEFFSENLQDKYVYEKFFYEKRDGFFIDIGAHGGIQNSNTYFFEKYLEWDGICFEPNPDEFKKLKKNRNCTVVKSAVSSKNGFDTFILHPCSFVSGLSKFYSEEHRKRWSVENLLKTGKAKLINVKTINLTDYLLKKNIDKIDLLSIDTEGAELEILKSIDFNKILIDVIIVENNYYDPEFNQLLSKNGYILTDRIKRDEIYKKNK